MRKGLVAYLIYGSALLALYGAGGFAKWWRGLPDFGGSGSGRSLWGSGGGGGFRGGK